MILKLKKALLLAALVSPNPLYAADDWGDDAWAEESKDAVELHGFLELALGGRTSADPVLQDDDLTLAELRSRIEAETYLGQVRYSGKLDIYADGVTDGTQLNLREALAQWSATDDLDFRLGHQVLTWGTGDLVFLNDLFAKDWVSFFSGRDDEYLKAPSTSLKMSIYAERASLDLVWTPVFAHDEFIEGERFSYFSPLSGIQQAAPGGKVIPQKPSKNLNNGEFAARLHGSASLLGSSSAEWAMYAYRGFWKQPNAINTDFQPYFSRLTAVGASLRSNLASGIGHAEFSWYRGDDAAGDDPFLPNDQLRFLLGYEQELIPNLTMGLQYYHEHLLDYAALTQTDGGSVYRPDEDRSLWTMRLTYRALRDNLILSWFSFYSPTDQDYYHRPSVKYRFNDQLNLTVGGNFFGGEQRHTFFGQFEDASNLYARLRWSY